MTPISGGDPDLCVSQDTQHPSPTTATCTWSAAGAGADDLTIQATDPNLRAGSPIYVAVTDGAGGGTTATTFTLLGVTGAGQQPGDGAVVLEPGVPQRVQMQPQESRYAEDPPPPPPPS